MIDLEQVKHLERLYELAKVFTFFGILAAFLNAVFIVLEGVMIDIAVYTSVVLFAIAVIIVSIAYVKKHRYSHYNKSEKTNQVKDLIEKYKMGHITMLEAVAESGIGFKEFMKILKENNIEIDYNPGALGDFR